MRHYTISKKFTGVTAATDLVKILAQATRGCFIYAVSVTVSGQVAQDLEVHLQTGTGGATTPSITPEKKAPNDTNFSGNVYDLSAGTDTTSPVVKNDQNVHAVAGFYYSVPPLNGFQIPGAGIFAVRLNKAITSADVTVNIEFAEMG